MYTWHNILVLGGRSEITGRQKSWHGLHASSTSSLPWLTLCSIHLYLPVSTLLHCYSACILSPALTLNLCCIVRSLTPASVSRCFVQATDQSLHPRTLGWDVVGL